MNSTQAYQTFFLAPRLFEPFLNQLSLQNSINLERLSLRHILMMIREIAYHRLINLIFSQFISVGQCSHQIAGPNLISYLSDSSCV